MKLTPCKAIRAHCLDCCLGHANEVRECPAEHCALWPWRFGRRPETRDYERREDGRTASYAIRSRCRDCMGGRVRRLDCKIPDCPLYKVA